MRLTRWLMIPPVLTLSACFGGDVDIVKKTVPHETPQYTLDQLLTKRAHCSDTTWRSFSDDRGRKIVEYVCTYAPASVYLQDLTDTARKKDQENNVAFKREATMMAEREKDELARKMRRLQEAKELLNQLQIRSENLGVLEQDLAILSKITSCSELIPEKFNNQYTIGKVTETISACTKLGDHIENVCSTEPPPSQIYKNTRQSRAERCNYERGESQPRIANIIFNLKLSIKKHAFLEKEHSASGLDSVKRDINMLESDIARHKENEHKNATDAETSIAKHDEESQKYNAWLDRRTDAFKSANEISQWTVIEGEVVHVGSKVNLNFDDAVVGSEVPINFVFRNALDNEPHVSVLYQVLLKNLFSRFDQKR